MSTHTGKDLDYDQYAGLLLSAATNYDMQFASTSSKSTRKVYNTELESSDFVMDSPSEVTEDTDYDIDASATTLLANMTNRGNANSDSYLPSEDYSSLSAEERDLWRKIPPSMKSIILKGRNSAIGLAVDSIAITLIIIVIKALNLYLFVGNLSLKLTSLNS
jgi:hypothetical protein